jgi:hypothetical protein
MMLPENLDNSESVFIMSGLIPNKKGHPLIHQWYGAVFRQGHFKEIQCLSDILERTQLGRNPFPNRQETIDTALLETLLPEAVKNGRKWISQRRKEFEELVNPKLDAHFNALKKLRAKQHQQVELRFADITETATISQQRREREKRSIDTLFDDYLQWIEDTLTTEDRAYVQVVAVLCGEK